MKVKGNLTEAPAETKSIEDILLYVGLDGSVQNGCDTVHTQRDTWERHQSHTEILRTVSYASCNILKHKTSILILADRAIVVLP